MRVLNDRELWALAAGDDPAAFATIYERHELAVGAYCLARCGDASTADDATSIVFLEAWRRRAELTLTTASAKPLLLGIAANVVRSQWRQRLRHRRAMSRLQRFEEPRGGHDNPSLDQIVATQRLSELREHVARLPRGELEVLSLIAWAELTYEEAAAALGVPVGTVRSRLSRARARLDPPAPGSLPGVSR